MKLRGALAAQSLTICIKLLVSVLIFSYVAHNSTAAQLAGYGLVWAVIGVAHITNLALIAIPINTLSDDDAQPHLINNLRVLYFLLVCFEIFIIKVFSLEISTLIGDESLGTYFDVCSFALLFSAFGPIDHALLQRDLQFSKIAYLTILQAVISTLIAFTVVRLGHPVFALISVQCTMYVAYSFSGVVVNKSARSEHDKGISLRRYLQRSGQFGLASGTATLLIHFPILLSSRFISTEGIAALTVGRRMMEIIGSQVSGVANSVLLPTLTKKLADKSGVSNIFLAVNRKTIGVMTIIISVLATNPRAFLETLGGHAVSNFPEVLIWLLIMQTILSLGQNVFTTYQAVEKYWVPWVWNVLFLALQVSALMIVQPKSAASYGAVLAGTAIFILIPVLPLLRLLGVESFVWFKSVGIAGSLGGVTVFSLGVYGYLSGYSGLSLATSLFLFCGMSLLFIFRLDRGMEQIK